MAAFLSCLLVAAIARPAVSWSPGGFPNQLGVKPFRGWRSWLAFQHQTDQRKMHAAIESMTKARGEPGHQVSLLDLGYSDVSLDGGWARCDGVNGSIHDENGDLLINTTLYPSFAQMNKFAHKHGLTSSWYLNCDQCAATQKLVESEFTETWYAKDSNKLAELEFDGVKFDTQPGGPNWNITKWAIAMNATGRSIMIEDCLDKHPDGTPVKKSTHPMIDILHDPVNCPFNFYRTGGDNFPTFNHGMRNTLLDSEAFLNKTSPVPASRPGCWAYPDQLAIGKSVMQEMWMKEGCPRLSFMEEQTLFGAWAIMSSPLVLSFDITNDTEVERLWPIIANKRALDINSQWAGEAGHVLKRSAEYVKKQDCRSSSDGSFLFPSYVVWAKRLSNPPDSIATLAINIGETKQSISISYEELTNSALGSGTNPLEMKGTDVWTGKTETYVLPGEPAEYHLGAHESKFMIWSPAEGTVAVSV